jgi:hypothetical protein
VQTLNTKQHNFNVTWKRMFRTGIDSTALEKEYVPLEKFVSETGEPNQKPIVVKALVGASVTTQDLDFDKKYQAALKEILQKQGIRQKKRIYKGAHLVKQISGKFDEVFTELLNAMEPLIEHIDVYFATYPKPYVSIYGKAQGQRLTPMEYIDKHQNGFDQACAWWNWNVFTKQEPIQEPEHEYYIDYFESKMTPGWTKMENNNANIKVYYSGCECNCLISFADLILKTIVKFHFGGIDYISIAQPIRKRSKIYALNKKIHSYNLSKYDWVIRETVPELPLAINLNSYIKHPIYFIAWTPTLPRKTVKPSFEWSKLYNAIIHKALDTDGCVKFLDFDKDMTFWEDSDFIIPWEPADEEHIRLLKSMGFAKMPKVLNASELIT